MKIRIKEIDGNIIVTLVGSFDTEAAREAEPELESLYEVAKKDIIIDCTQMDYISSAALRILLGLLQGQQEKKNGGQVFLKGVNEDVRHTFILTGFYNIFQLI